jgi:hypothetical protein
MGKYLGANKLKINNISRPIFCQFFCSILRNLMSRFRKPFQSDKSRSPTFDILRCQDGSVFDIDALQAPVSTLQHRFPETF